MIKIKYTLTFILLLMISSIEAASIRGTVTDSSKNPLVGVQILIEPSGIGAVTNEKGYFEVQYLSLGEYSLRFTYLGFASKTRKILIDKLEQVAELSVILAPKQEFLKQVVITGTRGAREQSESPVHVNVLKAKDMEQLQATNLAEGLNYQSGVRVETNCQTCNFTQLRMNGLSGNYTQVLINGRPIMNAMAGLYALEQIPTAMLSRVEVVKGGGSALYGSSAIGGVMNLVITPPLQNAWSIGQNIEMMGMRTPEYFSTANISNVSTDGNSSFNIFLSHRQRGDLDIDGDGFSEIPSINATTAGITGSWKLKDGKRISLNTGILNEYRRGGNKMKEPAYLADQSEERSQNMVFADLEYFQFVGKNRNQLNTWLSGQYTTRNHYTGALPDKADSLEYIAHIEEPPYGHTMNYSISSGVQYHFKPSKIFKRKNELILGAEYYFDHIRDAIPAFDYDLSQTIVNPAFYLQSIWDIGKRTVLQSGVRADVHNYLSNPAFNPRVALLYKLNPNSSLRANVSTGFRAPMFFDTDLHMSMAAGEVRRVLLSPELKTENSQTGCVTYMSDFPGDKHVFGFTVEGFYTRLQNAFQLEIMTDPVSGNTFYMKENAENATVAGSSVEFRARLWKKHMIMLSYTYQKSVYSTPVDWSEEIPGVRRFLRTPDEYGFVSYMTQLGKNWNTTVSGVYTGSMLIPHYGLAGDAGTPENDILFTSPDFFDLNLRLQKTLDLSKNNKLDLYIGVRNLLNSYQRDFDQGKNRDSDYVYGPARPRGFFFGVKLRG